MVVSSGLPITLSRPPNPLTRLAMPVACALSCGCMKSGACSSSALAQKTSYLGKESSSPSTWPPMAAPFSPIFMASSSCLAARSGNCRATAPKATNRPAGAACSISTQLLILKVDQPSGQIAIGRVPEGIDADGLDVDAFLVHDLQTPSSITGLLSRGATASFERRALEKIGHFGNIDVAVHVHGLDLLACHHHRLVLGHRSGRLRTIAASRPSGPAASGRFPPMRRPSLFRNSLRFFMDRLKKIGVHARCPGPPSSSECAVRASALRVDPNFHRRVL